MLKRIWSGTAALGILSFLAVGPSLGEEAEKFDPTDPTNIQFQMTPAYEYSKLSNGGGETHTFSVDTWIPLSTQDLLTIEVRGVRSEFPGLPTETRFGDIRASSGHGHRRLI